MPLDFSKITTIAAYNKVRRVLVIKRKGFQYRDLGLELADDRDADSATNTARQLRRVNSLINSANIILGTTGLEAEEITEAQDELAALLVRRTALLKRGDGPDDGSDFLTDVEGEQADMQADYLTTVIDRLDAHRLTLTT